MATMILLPNNCRCSELKVSPANWKKSSASTKKPWKIHYRFYDPAFNTPCQVTIKAGINKIKDLTERRTLVEKLIAAELTKLHTLGYNPFVKNQHECTSETDVLPSTPFVDALRSALTKLALAPRTKVDVRSVIKGVEQAAQQLQLGKLTVASVSRKHIKKILEQCAKNNARWSARRHNLYRAYLLMLFKELVEIEAAAFNPVRDVSKMKETKRLRTVLTDKQRKQIDKHLRKVDQRFLLFVHLFFHSGARLQELVQVKRADVNLSAQTFKAVVKKGRSYKEVERTIKDVALPYWKAFLSNANSDDYLFGLNFSPSQKPMVPDTVTRRWQKLVKQDLQIHVDLYSLKHLNTTETVSAVGDRAAAEQNAHTTTAMVISTYDVHRKGRQHQLLKAVKNTFA